VTTFVQQNDVMVEILRFHADGTRDKTFDGDGQLLIDAGAITGPDALVTVLKDNSIVVAIRQAKKPLLERYTVKGRLDASFIANVGRNYRPVTLNFAQFDQNEKLYTDSQGRIVFEQWVSEVNVGTDNERITARVSRYLPSGLADKSFGVRGGISIDTPLNLPQSYKIDGRVLNRRGGMFIDQPYIDSHDNVEVSGYRDYARSSSVSSDYSHVNLPFVYSFAGDGSIQAKFAADIDKDKSTFVNGALQYSGLDVGGSFTALTPDDTLYFYGDSQGLAVFKPAGNTFTLNGFDNTFGPNSLTYAVQVIGNKAWAVTFTVSTDDTFIQRLIELRPDATAGEVLAMVNISTAAVPYAGVLHDRPERIVGFRSVNAQTADDTQQNLVAMNLTEQDGSAAVVNRVLRITGTAAGDYITINKRSGKRYVVTGAGPTHSFAASSFSSVHVDALGGDDFVDANDLGIGATIDGQAGNDTLFGGQGSDLIDGGSGNDVVRANTGHNTLYGQSGDDDLVGSTTGPDDVFGGSGTDISIKTPGSRYDSVEVLNTLPT
jgi:hypothetical protein